VRLRLSGFDLAPKFKAYLNLGQTGSRCDFCLQRRPLGGLNNGLARSGILNSLQQIFPLLNQQINPRE